MVPEIVAATPVTLSLVLGAAVIWVVVSMLMGVAAAVLRGTIFDPMLMLLALIGISMPVFWLGEMANLITQDRYHDTFLFSWVPPLGYTPFTEDPVMWFKHLVIPWLTLSVLYIGLYARVLRSATWSRPRARTSSAPRAPRGSPSGGCSAATRCASR